MAIIKISDLKETIKLIKEVLEKLDIIYHVIVDKDKE